MENRANNNVHTTNTLPMDFGSLEAGESRNVTFTYNVPQGVNSFKVSIRMTFLDESGNQHFYPENVESPPADAINVKEHGVIGDGITDDTTAIQATINSAQTGSTVFFPAGTYKISTALSVNKPLNILSYDHATIHQTRSSTRGMNITGTGPVEINGLDFIGTQYGRYDAYETAIDASGNSNANMPLTGLTIKNCNINTWGGNGIIADWARGINIQNNNVKDIWYTGVTISSVIDGSVTSNNIDNISADGIVGTNAYGIAITRSSGTLDKNPRSANLSIDNNTVSNVTTWEGIDTHAGENIAFTNNRVLHCRTGIAVVDRDGLAPLSIDVSYNLVDWGLDDGLGQIGIVFKGTDNLTARATGSITNNIVKHHGEARVQNSAGIQIYVTQSVRISDNTLAEVSPNGIRVFYHNYDFAVSGNAITDVWTNNYFGSYGVRIGEAQTGYDHNIGSVSQPALIRGTKAALKINTGKVIIQDESPPTNQVVVS